MENICQLAQRRIESTNPIILFLILTIIKKRYLSYFSNSHLNTRWRFHAVGRMKMTGTEIPLIWKLYPF